MKAFFDAYTETMVKQVDTFPMPDEDKRKLIKLIRILRNNFNTQETRVALKEYLGGHDGKRTTRYPSDDFCSIATEIIYHLTGGAKVWEFMTIPGSVWKNGNHAYLIHKVSGKILDITKDQYTYSGIWPRYKQLGVPVKNFDKYLTSQEALIFLKAIGMEKMIPTMSNKIQMAKHNQYVI